MRSSHTKTLNWDFFAYAVASYFATPGTLVTEVTLNHEFLMSSYLTASERAVARIAIEMHGGNELTVLVGGLGLGYTAYAALSSAQVANCDVVEFLSPVIEWLKDGRIPLSPELNATTGLNVIHGDIYARLAAEPEGTYDLILIDVDHSPDDNLGSNNIDFYSAAGLQRAKLHLAKGGVLGVWSYAKSSSFADALHETFIHVRVEPITVFNNLIDVEQTDWLFFATDEPA